MSDVKDLV